jgi:epoxyqueuosine reductase
LTIEHRGELPAGLRLPAGRLYGCDLCLEACPLAQGPAAALPEFEPREALLSLSLEELLSLTPERYALLFRHSPIKRAKLAGLLRNARALNS